MPEDIRSEIQEQLWRAADSLDWKALGDGERSRHYERWTRDASIGGRLAHYMDPRKVRVYIKDTLLKSYDREWLSESEQQVSRILGITFDEVADRYVKPHGRCLLDGRVICWGKSRDWKLVLMAVFERSRQSDAKTPYAAVLIENGRTGDVKVRAVIREASRLLGIERMEWMDIHA